MNRVKRKPVGGLLGILMSILLLSAVLFVVVAWWGKPKHHHPEIQWYHFHITYKDGQMGGGIGLYPIEGGNFIKIISKTGEVIMVNPGEVKVMFLHPDGMEHREVSPIPEEEEESSGGRLVW